jgi:hypothetical protein
MVAHIRCHCCVQQYVFAIMEKKFQINGPKYLRFKQDN